MYLGNNVYIEAGCVIKNAQIGNACHIKPYCVIDRAEIGAGVDVGPFAHLRPETVLSDNSKVGNFVEIKKSTVGHGSKVNHLSYIGDTTIGTDVNVGAASLLVIMMVSINHKPLLKTMPSLARTQV